MLNLLILLLGSLVLFAGLFLTWGLGPALIGLAAVVLIDTLRK